VGHHNAIPRSAVLHTGQVGLGIALWWANSIAI
jgi:hypothetical protein